MRFACRIPKATNTHLQYVTLIAFPLKQSSQERASILRYTYILFLTGDIPLCSSKYMYSTVQYTTYVYQRIDEISVTSVLHVSAVKLDSD